MPLRHKMKVAKPPKAPQASRPARRLLLSWRVIPLLCEEGNSLREFNSFIAS